MQQKNKKGKNPRRNRKLSLNVKRKIRGGGRRAFSPLQKHPERKEGRREKKQSPNIGHKDKEKYVQIPKGSR